MACTLSAGSFTITFRDVTTEVSIATQDDVVRKARRNLVVRRSRHGEYGEI